MGAMTIPDDRLHELLRELSCEIELGRGRGSGWFGRHSMRPLSVTDREVLELRRLGLLEVLVWDDGPPRPERRRSICRTHAWETGRPTRSSVI